MDDLETTGSIALESGWSALEGAAKMINKDDSTSYDYFRLRLTTTDPYWSKIDLKIDFSSDELYGMNGFSNELVEVCRLIKSNIHKESSAT